MDLTAFEQQDDPTRPLQYIRFAAKEKAVETFTDVFGMDFFAFRSEMKEIGEAALGALEGVCITKGFSDFDEWFLKDDDEIIFPIDDDDVFSPRIIDLCTIDDETAVVVWPGSMLGLQPAASRLEYHLFDVPLLDTNNHGVRKSYLKGLPDSQARHFLAMHSELQVRLATNLGVPLTPDGGSMGLRLAALNLPCVRYVRRRYSIHFAHPASLLQISSQCEDGQLRRNLESMDLSWPGTPPPELSWAGECIERYKDLIDRLASARASRGGMGSQRSR